jgi:hypothetical protein
MSAPEQSPGANQSSGLGVERDVERPARRPSRPGTTKHEESLINALEAEEERLVNTLTRKLEKVRLYLHECRCEGSELTGDFVNSFELRRSPSRPR